MHTPAARLLPVFHRLFNRCRLGFAEIFVFTPSVDQFLGPIKESASKEFPVLE